MGIKKTVYLFLKVCKELFQQNSANSGKILSSTVRSRLWVCIALIIRDKESPLPTEKNQRQSTVNKRRQRHIVFTMAATRIHTAFEG
jgi:hypothetical protein